MKIRRHLHADETLTDLENYEELFLGCCCGVALVKRGTNDNHICYLFLTEDDGNWFPRGNSISSFWLEDEITVLNAVKDWLKENAKPDIYNNIQYNIQYGWNFSK